MKIKQMTEDIEKIVNDLTVEELEEKIAPVDCNLKPDHPDCQPVTKYGIPVPSK